MRYPKGGFPTKKVFENEKIIICKRMFDISECKGVQRYVATSKKDVSFYLQFKSITQVRKFIKSL